MYNSFIEVLLFDGEQFLTSTHQFHSKSRKEFEYLYLLFDSNTYVKGIYPRGYPHSTTGTFIENGESYSYGRTSAGVFFIPSDKN